MDFNKKNGIEADANVDFYIEYESANGINGSIDIIKQFSFYYLKLYQTCKKSINDWRVIYRNIIPTKEINYSSIW